MSDTRDIRHNNPKIMRLNTTESDNWQHDPTLTESAVHNHQYPWPARHSGSGVWSGECIMHAAHNGCRVLSYCWVRKIAKLEFENFVLLLHAELLLKQREPMKAFETRGSLWNTRRNSRRLFKSFFTAKAAQPYWIHCSLSGTTVIWILVSCPAPCPPPYATRSAKTRVTCR